MPRSILVVMVLPAYFNSSQVEDVQQDGRIKIVEKQYYIL